LSLTDIAVFRQEQAEDSVAERLRRVATIFLVTIILATAWLRQYGRASQEGAMPLPQTEIPGRLQSHLADRGIRMTQQRRAILQVMETATKHLDAAQLLRKAQKLDASVDRSTVYRTLRLLKRQGLIDELDLMHIHGEGHYYERKLNRDHIHMACLRCGKIMEFVSDIFEKLKGQVEKDCRFRIVVSRLEIGGYCAACSK
jgi:Fur family transcriptional regulator, ferric uptake regulator